MKKEIAALLRRFTEQKLEIVCVVLTCEAVVKSENAEA